VAVVHRPDHPLARRLLRAGGLACVGLGICAVLDVLPATARASGAGWMLNAVAILSLDVALAAWLDVFARFPDGRYADRLTGWLVRVAYPIAGGVALLTLLHGTQPVPLSWRSPPAVTVAPLPRSVTERVDSLPYLDSFLFLFVPIAVVVMLARYAQAGAQHRLQMRWPLAAMSLVAVLVVVSAAALPGSADSALASVLWGLSLSTVPVSLLVGMLRHRVLDIDLILRRSVTYALLWLAIAAAYGGIAVFAGVAAGGRISVPVAVVVTIVTAMLFQPVRERLERFADRIVYGERLSGYELVRRFGATLGSAFALTDLAPRLASTVRQGLEATWVRVSVRGSGDALQTAAVAGHAPDGSASSMGVDLVHVDEVVGRLDCGPRRQGTYRVEDEELLRLLGRQAAMAITNSRLAADLAASRTRIVQAEAAERRRIERNIHDGVQQQLVSLMAKLSVARVQLAAADPMAASGTLDEMQAEFRQAMADLRDLASGIHPPVLADQGLLAAVATRAARMPVGVSIECADGFAGARFDDQVEAAAYFTVSEALTNTLKHAGARHATVRIGATKGTLDVEVCDDGCGFDPSTVRAGGLRGLRDRAEALGGRLHVQARPGDGTRIRLQLPARSRELADG